MPEDQGVNGNIWNDKASKMMQNLHWTQIADSNVDIIGSDGKPYGIDRLMKFRDPRRSKKFQGVILEAKRYKWSSFSKSKLEDWIFDLDNKLLKIRNSPNLSEKFPDIGETILTNGAIFLWITDGKTNAGWEEKLQTIIEEVKMPNYRIGDRSNRIYLFSNEKLLQLSSLIDVLSKYDTKKGFPNFYFPASDRNNKPADTINNITLDFMSSKFALAKSRGEDGLTHNLVFYFGSSDLNSFRTLKSSLYQMQFISIYETLTIYYFEIDDEFRKIEPDIKRDFKDCKEFKLEPMQQYSAIPEFAAL